MKKIFCLSKREHHLFLRTLILLSLMIGWAFVLDAGLQAGLPVEGSGVRDATTVCAASKKRSKTKKVTKYALMISSGSSGKPFDIRRRSNLFLTKFGVVQGSCASKHYAYYAMQVKGGNSCKIVKVSLSALKSKPGKAVVKISRELSLGHANDMCYNAKTKRLYVVHNVEGHKPSMKISVISASTLKRIRTIKVKKPSRLKGASASRLSALKGMCAISYLPSKNIYVAMITGRSGNFIVLNSRFKPIRYIRCEKRTSYLDQGMDCTDKSIFVTRCKGSGSHYKNIIEEYSWTGKYKRKIIVKGIAYEIESMFHTGGTTYISCYGYNKYLKARHFGFIYSISNKPTVSGIHVPDSRIVLKSGQSKSLNARVTPKKASVRSIIYRSNKKKTATVSPSGHVRGRKPGDAKIILYSKQGYYTRTVRVAVMSTPKITSIRNKTEGILLKWRKQASSGKIVVLRKSGRKGAYKRIAVVRGGRSFYVDRRTKAGKVYSYKLYVVNGRLKTRRSSAKRLLRLKTPDLKKLTSYGHGRSSVRVRWKKVRGADCYDIFCSRNRRFKNKIVVRVKGRSRTSALLKGRLKRGKVYYIKIRAGRLKAKRNYSKFSSVRKIRVK